jgi:hypothetical protein
MHRTTPLVVLFLVACGSAAPPPPEPEPETTGQEEAPPPEPPPPSSEGPIPPIAWTEHPDIALAPPGPVRGMLDGVEVVMADVGFSLTGRVWSFHLAEHENLGAAEVVIPLTITPVSGATESTLSATTASFAQTADTHLWQGPQLGIALEITSGSFTPCPTGEGADTDADVGTASGRVVITLHDPWRSHADSYLAGTFENAALYCIPAT